MWARWPLLSQCPCTTQIARPSQAPEPFQQKDVYWSRENSRGVRVLLRIQAEVDMLPCEPLHMYSWTKWICRQAGTHFMCWLQAACTSWVWTLTESSSKRDPSLCHRSARQSKEDSLWIVLQGRLQDCAFAPASAASQCPVAHCLGRDLFRSVMSQFAQGCIPRAYCHKHA